MSLPARLLAVLAAIATAAAYAELAEIRYLSPMVWLYQTGAAASVTCAVLLALFPIVRDPDSDPDQ